MAIWAISSGVPRRPCGVLVSAIQDRFSFVQPTVIPFLFRGNREQWRLRADRPAPTLLLGPLSAWRQPPSSRNTRLALEQPRPRMQRRYLESLRRGAESLFTESRVKNITRTYPHMAGATVE